MKKSVSVNVVNTKGEPVSVLKLDGSVFDAPFHDQCVFDAIQVEQANSRQATAKTKVRSEVRGGGRKPWRQKGTGRARAGSTRSPIWVGGGTAFGPTGTQNYKLSQNKKEYAIAKRSVLAEKARNSDLIVLDSLATESKKTKEFVTILDALSVKDKVLVVVSEEQFEKDENLLLSARNLRWVKVVPTTNVSVYDVMNTQTLLATEEAIKTIESQLKVKED